MGKNIPISVTFAVILGSTAGGTWAQQVSVGPAGVAWGPVIVYPSLDASIRHDDNIFLQPAGERSSNVSILAPMVRLQARKGALDFGLTARLEDGTFHSSKADNYTDYQLAADASLAFTPRSQIRLLAEHNRGHDQRGSVVGLGIGETPNEYTTTALSGVYAYGAEGAKGRIEIDGGVLARRYQNNPTLTARSDRDEQRLGATFFWRVMPKTRLLFHLGQSDFDYKLATSNLDSKERRYLIGATWEATAKTVGTIRAGRVEKDFTSLTDFSGVTWEGQINWSPLTHSTVDVLLSKKPNESNLGSASFDRTASVAWNHAWNSRLGSTLSFTDTRSEYKGSGINGLTADRRDTTRAYSARLSYQLKRWLRLGIGYDRTDRTSNSAGGGYDRNVLMFFISATL